MGTIRAHEMCCFVALLAAVWLPGAVRAADLSTVNSSQAAIDQNSVYASAPASCTGTNSAAELTVLEAEITGMGFDLSNRAALREACNERGDAAVWAAANGALFNDSEWSDIEHNIFGLDLLDLEAEGNFITDMGQAWSPLACFGPECGHMLQGDVAVITAPDGSRDFSLNQAFSWGVTSKVGDNLSDQLMSETDGGLAASAPGAVRMMLRQALGSVTQESEEVLEEYPPGSGVFRLVVRYKGADPANPRKRCEARIFDEPDGNQLATNKLSPALSCLDGVVDQPAHAAVHNGDARIWGQCDPDRFFDLSVWGGQPDSPAKSEALRKGQNELNNCLMRLATIPLTGPKLEQGGIVVAPYDSRLDAASGIWTDGVTTLDFSAANNRDHWIDQAVLAYIENHDDTPGQVQDYFQKMYAAVGFMGTVDLARAGYLNDWDLQQSDFPLRQHTDDPYSPIDTSGHVPTSADATYGYTLSARLTTMGVQRTCTDSNGDPVPNCVEGVTNNTLAPEWGFAMATTTGGEVIRDADGYIQFDYSRDIGFFAGGAAHAGVGEARDEETGRVMMAQLYSQQTVEEYLFTCLNCDTPELIGSGGSHAFDPHWEMPTFIPYTSSWHSVPTITHAPIQ